MKAVISTLALLFPLSCTHAKLLIKNANIPIEQLSPAQGMMSSNKNSPVLFDFPALGKVKELPSGGNYFNLIITPSNVDNVRCFLNKADNASVPFDKRQGLDIPRTKTTTIIVKWTPEAQDLECEVSQK